MKIGRSDERLLDSSPDRLHAHGRWINVRRLRTFDGRRPNTDSRVLSEFAEALRKKGSPWESRPAFAGDQGDHGWFSPSDRAANLLCVLRSLFGENA